MVEGTSKDPLTPRNVFAYYCTENECKKGFSLISQAECHEESWHLTHTFGR